MRLLAYLGYLIMGVLVVVVGNAVWSVVSVKWAEKLGYKFNMEEEANERSN